MTGAVCCSQMLYWQSRNQWAHLRPGCQKGNGKAIAENLTGLPTSITVLVTLRCVSLLSISTTRGFPYDPTLQRGLWMQAWGVQSPLCTLHALLELPSTLGYAELAVKNKLPASMEKHRLLEKDNRAKPSPAHQPAGVWWGNHLAHGCPQAWRGCSEIPQFAGDPQVLQVVGYLTEGEQIQRNLTEQVDKYVADELQ